MHGADPANLYMMVGVMRSVMPSVFPGNSTEGDTPFIIGVAGDSGSGKTTFTEAIRVILGPGIVTTITLDDYHRYDRNERAEKQVTPLHPDANRFDRLAADLAALRQGRRIQKPVYNHETGTFDPEEPFVPGDIIILEGLHTLFTEEIRQMIDLSIYVDPDPAVKYAWKIKRDVAERGHSREAVEEEIEIRKPDYEQYVEFQRAFADIVVHIGESIIAPDADPPLYCVQLIQKRCSECLPQVPLTLDLARVIPLEDGPFGISGDEMTLDGREMVRLTLDGYLPYGIARALEESIENQTTICALQFYPGRQVTPTNIISLLIAWRVICRECNLSRAPKRQSTYLR